MSKEDVMLTCLHGEEKKILTQKMLNDHLTDMLNLLERNTMEACVAQEKIINAIIPDGNYLYYNTFLVDNYVARAVFYVRDNEFEKAMDALKKAHKFAIDYDSFLNHETYRFTSPFLDAEEHKTADICRSGTSTRKEDFMDFVKRSGFDALKDREDFQAFFSD